ncbi:NnrS family protein [Palleronia sediminis]|uniref:NnrS family protein n=1 Tax=Palleronia sediminis TaxID=2547833 RepID=A0A4R6A9D2_9RHOB|nr:NnrS family protein [Palleronia sediminis]TDL79422.1 NnrS family protein [Palleronia sediminis]
MRPYTGPAILGYGFRPFFLSACIFATLAIPLWLAIWRGAASLDGTFSPTDWHIHEMLFGYAGAVIAGFLFTAVPNWTGRMPRRGLSLALLAALWPTGRLAVAGVLGLSPFFVAAIDVAFLVAIAGITAVEIVAGRNWRNLKVVVPVSLLALANAGYHAEAAMQGEADIARRLGMGLVVFLILLIGGRVIPSFTRNWLAARNAARLPAPFARFDGIALALTGPALIWWTVAPYGPVTAVLLTIAAVAQAARLSRWCGLATLRNPLLLMLHAAFAFVPLGFVALAAAALGWAFAATGLHLLGIGAIGGMTAAVMMRATQGHTGRPLQADRLLVAAFCLIGAAALVRAGSTVLTFDAITAAAVLWTLGFGALTYRLAPWLIGASVSKRTANPAPARG